MSAKDNGRFRAKLNTDEYYNSVGRLIETVQSLISQGEEAEKRVNWVLHNMPMAAIQYEEEGQFEENYWEMLQSMRWVVQHIQEDATYAEELIDDLQGLVKVGWQKECIDD